jgi:hypothetical protein
MSWSYSCLSIQEIYSCFNMRFPSFYYVILVQREFWNSKGKEFEELRHSLMMKRI